MSAKGLSSRAIIGEFYYHLEQDVGLSWINEVSMLFQSDQENEVYKWLGQIPTVREWVGGRQAKGLSENGITIINKRFEATIAVLVDELRRDKTGQVLVRIRELAERTNAHWGTLLSLLIVNGKSQISYDNHYFFDTEHEEGQSGVQSNCIQVALSALPIPESERGSTTEPSARVMKSAILRGVRQILGFKDDQGEPMNETAQRFLVLVPTQLMDVANAAMYSPVLSGSETNDLAASPNFGITYAVNPRLTWQDQFVVFRTDGSVAPFIRQEETPVQLNVIAEGTEEAFKNDQYLYGVKCNRNVGYGYWQKACLVQLV